MTLAAAGAIATTCPAATRAAARAPVIGGILRVAASGASTETLDPFTTVSSAEDWITYNIYDGLLRMDPSGVPKYSLATSLQPNAARDIWVATLRPGVRFHDGSVLSAKDVVYSFKRMLDPALHTESLGYFPFLKSSGVKALDGLQIEFRLERPYADFLSTLAQKGVCVIKEGLTDYTRPNGTGPFKMADWRAGQRTRLARHAAYHGGPAYLDGVEIVTINNPAALTNGLLGGQVDFSELQPSNQIPIYKAQKLQVFVSTNGQFDPLVMDVRRKPFNDPRVRKALKLVVDRSRLIRILHRGLGRPGNDLWGTFDPISAAARLPQRAQDLNEARRLLKEARLDGLSIDLHTADVDPSYVPRATVFAEDCKAAGIKVNLRIGPADSYWDNVYRKVSFFQTGWNARPFDALLNLVLGSNAPFNESYWSAEGFERLRIESQSTADAKKRAALSFELQRMIWDDGPYICTDYGPKVDVAAAHVRGYESEAYPTQRLERIWLDKNLRQSW